MKEFKITGDWERIKENLKKEYPALTDTDLAFDFGKEDELLGRIERRLGGEKRERIMDRIKTMDNLLR